MRADDFAGSCFCRLVCLCGLVVFCAGVIVDWRFASKHFSALVFFCCGMLVFFCDGMFVCWCFAAFEDLCFCLLVFLYASFLLVGVFVLVFFCADVFVGSCFSVLAPGWRF